MLYRLFAILSLTIFPLIAQATPVRVKQSESENQWTYLLQDSLRPQGWLLSQSSTFWVQGVRVTDKGVLERLQLGSLTSALDAQSASIQVRCDSAMEVGQTKWAMASASGSNPSCRLNPSPVQVSDDAFSSVGWYPHSGLVDRKTFQTLYEAFADELAKNGSYTPSWTRDAWILRVQIDDSLQVRRLWIYASALVDRETLNLEKRGDCHGEVYWTTTEPARPQNGKRTQSGFWAVSPGYSCRMQLYKFAKTCYGAAKPSEDCEWEWVPCEGASCESAIDLNY